MSVPAALLDRENGHHKSQNCGQFLRERRPVELGRHIQTALKDWQQLFPEGLVFFFNLKNVPLIYFWLCWVFVAQAFSELWRVGATLQLLCVASQCGGFSCCGAQAFRHTGFSRCGSWALEQRLNSCGSWA